MHSAIEQIWAYHRATAHHPDRYAPSPGFLDWDSQPDPFRRFLRADQIPLPVVRGDWQPEPSAPIPSIAAVGLFCDLAAGLSAWKSIDGARWALRNRPSSGNLHPTETTLILFRPLDVPWRDLVPDGLLVPGVYRYNAFSHGLDCRRRFSPAVISALIAAYPDYWGCLGLSTIAWREEWKYGSRAYRYCQLDVGHAIAAAQAAYAVVFAQGTVCVESAIPDAVLSQVLGLDDPESFADAEPETPDCLLWLGGGQGGLHDFCGPDVAPLIQAMADEPTPWHGTASRLSAERVKWPEVALAEAATVKPSVSSDPGSRAPRLLPTLGATTPRGEWLSAPLIRQRRSAQRMDPQGVMRAQDVAATLGRLRPSVSSPFWRGFPFAPAIVPLMMVHAVEGLPPGLYAVDRCGDGSPFTAGAEPVAGWPQLYRIGESRSVRREASQLSCYQGLAGRGAVAWALLAPMARVLASDGAWAYRRLHWEAGLIGQILYLSAEAAGLRGTGIGCFMDRESAALAFDLDVSAMPPEAADAWQTLYHFTIGQALEDQRLSTEPPYGHLPPWRFVDRTD